MFTLSTIRPKLHYSGRRFAIQHLLLFLPALCLFGCASPPTFDSNKEPSYKDTLQRVLIVNGGSHWEKLGADYGKELANELATKLRARGVTVEVLNLKPLELNGAQTVRAAVDRFGAKQLLQVAVAAIEDREQTQTHPSLSGGLSPNTVTLHFISFTLEFRLNDPPLSREVWRGTMHFDDSASPKDVAKELVEKLPAAGLL